MQVVYESHFEHVMTRVRTSPQAISMSKNAGTTQIAQRSFPGRRCAQTAEAWIKNSVPTYADAIPPRLATGCGSDVSADLNIYNVWSAKAMFFQERIYGGEQRGRNHFGL